MNRCFCTLLCAFVILHSSTGQEEEFSCSSVTYDSDVKGLSIICEQFPSIESKVTACFKDLWWKYLAYEFWSQPLVYDPNPFAVLDVPVCRRKCQCVIEIHIRSITCLARGRAPTWTKEFTAKQRTAFYCRDIKLPKELISHADEITFALHVHSLDVTPEGVPVLVADIMRAVDDQVKIESFKLILFHLGNDSNGAWPPIESVDQFFTGDRLRNLTSFFIAMSDTNGRKPRWPNIGKAFDQMSPNLMFLYLSDLNITSIPRPPFAGTLKTLVCDRCSWLVEAPTWLEESRDLLFLHISRASLSFPLSRLPPIKSLLHFSFCDSPLKTLPGNFSIPTLYPNLENLDLSNLALTTIPVDLLKGLSSLRRLDLGGNCLAPMPSFKDLRNLVLVNLDGLASIAGTNAYFLGKDCQYGACGSLTLNRTDLSDLINLEILSLSYYRKLEIDEDAFANLTKLKRFTMNCVNMTRLPSALSRTCGLRSLTAILNPFKDVRNDSSYGFVPPFVPKYYKNLTFINFDNSSLTLIPPTMLVFDVTKESNLLRRMSLSLTNNPVSSNECEIYKFETAYKMESSMAIGFGNKSAACQKELENMIQVAKDVLRNTTDHCSVSGAGVQNTQWWMFLLVVIGLYLAMKYVFGQ